MPTPLTNTLLSATHLASVYTGIHILNFTYLPFLGFIFIINFTLNYKKKVYYIYNFTLNIKINYLVWWIAVV